MRCYCLSICLRRSLCVQLVAIKSLPTLAPSSCRYEPRELVSRQLRLQRDDGDICVRRVSPFDLNICCVLVRLSTITFHVDLICLQAPVCLVGEAGNFRLQQLGLCGGHTAFWARPQFF